MHDKKNIWIVSEFYYPVVTSTGYYMTEIAEKLASFHKFNVNVLTTNALYNEKSEYDYSKDEIKDKVKIHRIKVKQIDKNSLFQRFFRLFNTSCILFISLLKRVNSGDKLLVVTNPAFLLLFLPILKKIRRVDYYLLVHDIFPENLAAIDKMKSDSFFYRFLKKIFDWAYSKANKCISIGRDMSEIIRSKTCSENICLITNWADVDKVFPIPKESTSLIEKLKISDKFIFQFAGNLGHAQGIDNLLEVISQINNPDIHFLFIGNGAKYSQVKNFAKQNINTTSIDFIDREFQNDFLNACDVSIVTLADKMFGLGVPSKAYNIMATGKPILFIGDSNSEIALCIKQYKLGWIVQPNNQQELLRTFEEIFRSKDSIKEMSKNIRETAESVFGKNIILDKYITLLQ